MAAQGSVRLLGQANQLDKTRRRQGNHLAGTRFSKTGSMTRKQFASGGRTSVSKSKERMCSEGKARKPTNPYSRQKKLTELQKRRLPAYGSVRSAKIVHCSRMVSSLKEGKAKKASKNNSRSRLPEAVEQDADQFSHTASDIKCTTLKKSETATRNDADLRPG